ncbi:MAG TPA: COX15/CtaA family protein [Rhodocyclaceae bacterium]|nr:COX15/CtaA family protein [Rhodocyclaceae bacterium]
MMALYRRLLPLAALLAFGVVALGAWVRLSDAGLGCPDWPGCYGQWMGVPEHAADVGKAWKEMVHRYFAGTLGLLIFALCLLSWRQRPRLSPVLPTTLAGIVVCQALLGMWTVTLLLKPLVVSAHLLGGMTTLALLVWLNLREVPARGVTAPGGLRTAGLLALALVALQIALGGWVSSNYAALACPDFPACQGQWLPAMDFGHAFTLHRELGQTASGTPLALDALTAIHWSHRLGAVLVAAVVGGLGAALLRQPGWRHWGTLVLGLVALQFGLGVANVLLALPLPVAVAHNAGAALLLSGVLAVNFRLWKATPAYGKAGIVGSTPLHSASG